MPAKGQKIKTVINRYRQELKKLGINAEKIILYGSYARGRSCPSSDIDLIVVSNDFKGANLRERLEILGMAAGKVFEPIEALGYTQGEIRNRQKASFIEEIFNSPYKEY